MGVEQIDGIEAISVFALGGLWLLACFGLCAIAWSSMRRRSRRTVYHRVETASPTLGIADHGSQKWIATVRKSAGDA